MTTYTDDMFVYVDPNARKVIGVVEWEKEGKPKRLAMPEKVEDPDANADEEGASKAPKGKKGKRPVKKRTRYYPRCSYRNAKRVYRVEGKEKDV